jgi:hypothetical protein
VIQRWYEHKSDEKHDYGMQAVCWVSDANAEIEKAWGEGYTSAFQIAHTPKENEERLRADERERIVEALKAEGWGPDVIRIVESHPAQEPKPLYGPSPVVEALPVMKALDTIKRYLQS